MVHYGFSYWLAVCRDRFLVASALLLIAGTVPATAETNHYPNGTSGILAGSVPGPGFYYLMYNLYYQADQLKDGSGNSARVPGGDALDFQAKAFANVHRFIHVTQLKIHGCRVQLECGGADCVS